MLNCYSNVLLTLPGMLVGGSAAVMSAAVSTTATATVNGFFPKNMKILRKVLKYANIDKPDDNFLPKLTINSMLFTIFVWLCGVYGGYKLLLCTS